jgi:peptidoglycan/LPS O-acetylase OafA/YrhL
MNEVSAPSADAARARIEKARAKRKLHTIDGLRGLAAAVIVLSHTRGLVPSLGAASSYLAVDLFFLLGGFIISFVYDDRFRSGMRPLEFIRVRLIRLYPLYALTSFLSAALFALQIATGPSHWTWPSLGVAVVAGALILPSVPPSGIATIFPLNGPAWSLFYMLLANLLYAAAFPFLTLRRLVFIVGIGLIAITATVAVFGRLSGGAMIGYPELYTSGWARVGFSFFAGVLLCRMYQSRRLPRPWLRNAWVVLAVVACFLFVDPGAARPFYDLLLVVVVFPVVLVSAVQVEPRRFLSAFTFLGVISYPLYATHDVFLRLMYGSVKVFGISEIPVPTPLFALAFLGCLSGVGWYLDRFFDQPVRKWLWARTRRERR